jgi:hypothetical protein
MELLVEYKSGDLIFSTINSCYKLFPKETEAYLLKWNLLQLNSRDRWRKIGFRNDPKSRRKSVAHDYDEFTTDPKILALIKKCQQKAVT